MSDVLIFLLNLWMYFLANTIVYCIYYDGSVCFVFLFVFGKMCSQAIKELWITYGYHHYSSSNYMYPSTTKIFTNSIRLRYVIKHPSYEFYIHVKFQHRSPCILKVRDRTRICKLNQTKGNNSKIINGRVRVLALCTPQL